MVHWMIQVLLRLAPNPPESPQEAIDACLSSAWSLGLVQEKAVGLFDRITSFSNYITRWEASQVQQYVSKLCFLYSHLAYITNCLSIFRIHIHVVSMIILGVCKENCHMKLLVTCNSLNYSPIIQMKNVGVLMNFWTIAHLSPQPQPPPPPQKKKKKKQKNQTKELKHKQTPDFEIKKNITGGVINSSYSLKIVSILIQRCHFSGNFLKSGNFR